MNEIEDIRWNYFTASRHEEKVNVYPGEGNYRWGDVYAYLRKVTWDNTTQMPKSLRKETYDFLGSIPEQCGASFIYPDDHIGPRLVCLYADDGGHDADEVALSLFASLAGPMHHSLGIHGPQMVGIPDLTNETAETLGRIELRIALLHEEAGFPREAPVLWPSDLKLLDLYNAVEENFNAVKALAMLPVFSDEVRHEACSLTYTITGALRADLYAKARAEGVPLLSDPYISWSSRTSQSKEW
jgi:hypothetical protein